MSIASSQSAIDWGLLEIPSICTASFVSNSLCTNYITNYEDRRQRYVNGEACMWRHKNLSTFWNLYQNMTKSRPANNTLVWKWNAIIRILTEWEQTKKFLVRQSLIRHFLWRLYMMCDWRYFKLTNSMCVLEHARLQFLIFSFWDKTSWL